MKKRDFQMPAPMGTTREGFAQCGKGYSNKDFQAVVYDNFSGFPMLVTFLGERWWVTSPGEPLQPLDEYLGGEDISYIFLCEAGGTVGALALAKMLGKAMEFPEDNVMEVLEHRMVDLKRLGVTLDVKDERLTLELRVFKHKKDSFRRGKYSVWCHAADSFYDMLFDVDDFNSEDEAEEWANYYFDFLSCLGINITVTINNKV